ncbi:hypothetical protein K3495_g12881 [Podosphaera aphanis]|nr:hypothetical protein K3495_g12881 [Podosphaera aphanis]
MKSVPKSTPQDNQRIVHETTNGTTKTPKQVATALKEAIGVSVTRPTPRNVLATRVEMNGAKETQETGLDGAAQESSMTLRPKVQGIDDRRWEERQVVRRNQDSSDFQ